MGGSALWVFIFKCKSEVTHTGAWWRKSPPQYVWQFNPLWHTPASLSLYVYLPKRPLDSSAAAPKKKKKKHSNPSLRHAGTAAKPFSCSIDTQNREEGLRDRHIVKGVGKYKGRLNEGQRLSSEQLLWVSSLTVWSADTSPVLQLLDG